jgi:heme/copper-type cytochrome/quinol oxidase subunit 2
MYKLHLYFYVVLFAVLAFGIQLGFVPYSTPDQQEAIDFVLILCAVGAAAVFIAHLCLVAYEVRQIRHRTRHHRHPIRQPMNHQ